MIKERIDESSDQDLMGSLNALPYQNRTEYPNFYLKNMKPVPLEVGLEFHEKLVHKVDQSLKVTKHRLQKTELLLNLEPPLDEPSHHEEWEATIADLLSANHRLEFPKYSRIQKQHEIQQLLLRQSKSRERARSREDYNRRAAMILAKETQNLQKKILSGKVQFGGTVKGTEIRTLHDYKGCNTFDRGTRILVRKDGQKLPESHESCLPPWFGPQFYEVKYNIFEKKDSSYRVAFKSRERDATSSELVNRENIRRRRKEVLIADQLNAEELSSIKESRKSFPGRIVSEDVNDEDSESVTFPLQVISKEHDQDVEVTSIASSIMSKSDDLSEESLGKILEKYDSVMIRSTRREDHQNRRSKRSLAPNHLVNRERRNRNQKNHSNLITMGDSMPTVLNPLVTHHSYALKILEAENQRRKKGWKPRDYTLNALVNQRPIEFSTYFLEDTFIDPNNANNTNGHDSTTIVSKPSLNSTVVPTVSLNNLSVGSATTIGIDQQKSNLKYSSEIFRLKPATSYKSSDLLLRELDQYVEKRQKILNLDKKTPSNRTQPLPPIGSPSSAISQSVTASANKLQVNDLLDGASQASSQILSDQSSHPQQPAVTFQSLSAAVGELKEASFESSSLANSVESFGTANTPPLLIPHSRKNEANSPSRALSPSTSPILKISTKQFLRSSFSTKLLSPSTKDLSPSKRSISSNEPDNKSFGGILKQWYKENEIIRYKATAGPTLKQKFLQSQLESDAPLFTEKDDKTPHYQIDSRRRSVTSPRKRPSIDLSLRGLLLDDNPYLTKEQQEQLIKENMNKDINDIHI